MNTPVVTFDPAGTGHCLFTEAIDLSALGALEPMNKSIRKVWTFRSDSDPGTQYETL